MHQIIQKYHLALFCHFSQLIFVINAVLIFLRIEIVSTLHQLDNIDWILNNIVEITIAVCAVSYENTGSALSH